MNAPAPALELRHIAKRFGAVRALADGSIVVRRGTVHALLGENGAGKTTLMRIAFGMVRADAGEVLVDGAVARLARPADAIARGIGMVHQHFTNVPAMTVAENVALGAARGRHRYRAARAADAVRRIAASSGLALDPGVLAADLPASAQQRLEIVKALARDARTLILDEPTAVLAPAEVTELLAFLRRFADAGGAAVVITHKLREALAAADDVTVMRAGRTVATMPARAATAEALARAMLGEGTGEESALGAPALGAGAPPRLHDAADEPIPAHHSHAPDTGTTRRVVTDGATPSATVTPTAGVTPAPDGAPRPAAIPSPAVTPPPATAPPPIAAARDLYVRDERGLATVRGVTLELRAGEILGVAGVEGAGQRELLRALAGRLPPVAGELALPAPERIGFVPEDRHRDAIIADWTLTENVALRGAGRARGILPWGRIARHTAALIAEHDVRAPSPEVPIGALSGGNQQKLVLARELDGRPLLLVVENPTRGLDIAATQAVQGRLRRARDAGAAVVLASSDLDEVLAIADRVVVMFAGRAREVPPDRDAVGRAMLGLV
ncbi:MAG TPA: ATP-binding cassette domain-containing protein [Gemmatimonadaceae bacterium]|nr:ATP-binding cassette domain-containing protein [Gemmatimonadaceae bacterium]